MGQAEADRQREKAANSVGFSDADRSTAPQQKWMWCVPNSNKNTLSPLVHHGPSTNVSWMPGQGSTRSQPAPWKSFMRRRSRPNGGSCFWLIFPNCLLRDVERIVILDTLGIMSIDILSGGCWLHVRCQQEKMVDSLLERLKKKAGSEAGCALPPWSLP